MSRLREAERGNSWRIRVQEDNTITFDNIKIELAQDIRDTLVEIRDELKGQSSQMATIRHFFHQPGLATAMRSILARENRRERQRKARNRARRKR